MSGRGKASSFQSPLPVPGLSVLWIEAGRSTREVKVILCFWPHVWSGGIPDLILALWVAGGLHQRGCVARKSDCDFPPHIGPSRYRASPETRLPLAASTPSSLFEKGLPHWAATGQHCAYCPRPALHLLTGSSWRRDSHSQGLRDTGSGCGEDACFSLQAQTPQSFLIPVAVGQSGKARKGMRIVCRLTMRYQVPF